MRFGRSLRQSIGSASGILLLGFLPISWSQPIVMYAGTPFEPSSAEIAEVIELATDVPVGAELESAYYTTSQRVIGAQPIETIRRNTYTFYWPLDELVDDVRFYRKARCARQEREQPKCTDLGRFARWRDSLVDFDEQISRPEFVEALKEAARLMPVEQDIVRLERVAVSDRGRRFSGVRRYRVMTRRTSGDYSYDIERLCASAADCRWAVLSVGRIAY